MLDVRKSFFEAGPQSKYTASNTIVGFDVSQLPAGTVARGWLLLHPDDVKNDDTLGVVADWVSPQYGAYL